MKDIESICRIAVVQAEPVMFDKSASLEKALRCIDEAAAHHPNLIVFPELFIPGYPVGMNFGFSIGRRSEEGRKDWKRYYDASAVAGGSGVSAACGGGTEHRCLHQHRLFREGRRQWDALQQQRHF